MKIQLPSGASRTLKFTAIALFCFSTTTSILAQEPMHALEHADSNGLIEKTGDDTRPAPEVALIVAQNPSPTGIFTVKTEEEDVLFAIYDESMNPIQAEIENQRPGTYVIDLTQMDNGTYTLVASGTLNRTLVDLIKRETEVATKMNEIEVQVFPNPSTGVFNIIAENNAKIQVFDRYMQPVNAMVQNLLENQHRIDITTSVAGLYFIQVITKSGMATKQVSKR